VRFEDAIPSVAFAVVAHAAIGRYDQVNAPLEVNGGFRNILDMVQIPLAPRWRYVNVSTALFVTVGIELVFQTPPDIPDLSPPDIRLLEVVNRGDQLYAPITTIWLYLTPD
jgi:hypothetical protein